MIDKRACFYYTNLANVSLTLCESEGIFIEKNKLRKSTMFI